MDEAPRAAATQASSTLIEFPGVSRASRPQWRKELSERVREIQERRSRDSTKEVEEALRRPVEPQVADAVTPQLGLVPQPDTPAMNPIVAAALKRLERARQPNPPMPRARASMGGAAAAVARVAEDQYQPEAKQVVSQPPIAALMPVEAPAQPVEDEKTTKAAETAREHTLIVVPAQLAKKVTAVESKPQPSRLIAPEVTAEAGGVSHEEEFLKVGSEEEFYDDRAPVGARLAGSVIDLLVAAFASSPFAAIIELTNGNWADWRVVASMGGIVLIVTFLYLTASTALAGRTWGMSVVSLRAVDAETSLPPTTKQSVARALFYILSLVTLGLGLIYALFDAEGRTAHDHFSGTIVVRD
ncbi:MAG TPA: RDD family protein [Pyrinomonadaceae bacterium]|nr:RDD family protein [Pyrinomonadaceae bacterium]